ncbi:MAG: PaaI family thioesterase, partial [Acidobacteria bacterium]|nr:PaaI family thioesterase [Acidobacteriota bacterium]
MRLKFEDLAHEAVRALARGLRLSAATRMFGFELDAAEPGRAVLRMKIGSRHRQLHGVVHGGVLAALADTAAALACYLVLPRGTRLATIEMKINYLEPVAQGILRAEGRLLRKGKSFCVAKCDIRDPENRMVATSLLTFAI